jgi:hypothetical protein
MKEKLHFRGDVKIKRYLETGELAEQRDVKNLVVTTGLEWIIGRLNAPVPPVMSYIAVGTNNTVPQLNQTTLITEIWRQPTTVAGGSVSGVTIVYTTAIGPGNGTGALQEAGIFDQGSLGTMLSRVTYPVINKGASDTVVVEWTISAQSV